MNVFVKAKKIGRFITDPYFRFHVMASRGFRAKTDAKEFLLKAYKFSMGEELNLEDPQKYTEKLQWLKIFDHRPEYTIMVDKYTVKQYVAERIGEEYVIPLLGVWERVEDIDFASLPEKFVLKTTHHIPQIQILLRMTLDFLFELVHMFLGISILI